MILATNFYEDEDDRATGEEIVKGFIDWRRHYATFLP